MNKVWKKITVIVAVLCLTLACALLSACGDSKTTYAVKVVLPDTDETPVENVQLTFYGEDDEVCAQVLTNADGIVKVTLTTANYRVKITDGMPDGYTLFNADSEIYQTKNWSKNNCIITLDEAYRTYTVTVTLPGGSTPAPNVDVIFTPESADAETEVVTTGTNGKVSVTLPADVNYIVTLDTDTLPQNAVASAADENGISTITASEGNITFALEYPVRYSFRITGPAGVDLEGIEVSYSATVSGNRNVLGMTDADGALQLIRSEISGYAFIKAPDGYVYNENYDETNSPYKLDYRITTSFTLLKHNEISLETKMSDSAIEAFDSATASNNTEESVFAQTMKQVGRSAYSFETDLAQKEIQIFSFVAQETGDYNFFVNFSNATVNAYQSLNLDKVYTTLPSKSMTITISCTKGTRYYYSVESETEQHIQIVVASPAEKNDYYAEETGNYELTIKQSLPAMFYFTPSVSGEYTVTVQNGESGYLIEQISPVSYTVMETSENGTIIFTITNNELFYPDGTRSGTVIIYRFTTTMGLPHTFSLNIQKTGEAVDKTAEYVYVKVEGQLEPQDVPQGALKQIGIIDTNRMIIRTDDGSYHYGTADGPLVYVKLKGKIPVFYPSTDFEKLDTNTSWYSFLYSSTETTNVYYNYAEMLRGYKTYEDEGNTAAYAQEYYLKYVNSDGVYPLNDQLKGFLERVASQQKSFFISCVNGYNEERDASSLWLFSSFYYDPNGLPEEDEKIDTSFEGSGTQNDPYLISFESGADSVKKGVTVNVTENDVVPVYCKFTAREEGNYIITLLDEQAEIDGRVMTDVANGYPYYEIHLEANGTVEFALTATNIESALFYAFTIELAADTQS